jgi:hypothetical protein
MLEVSMIRSLAGDLAGGRIGRVRPFRAPHHPCRCGRAGEVGYVCRQGRDVR